MIATTLSSHEFNEDPSSARKAADNGPVFISSGGRPTHVLLSIEDYQKLARQQSSIVELLAMPDGASIEFDPPRMRDGLRPGSRLR